MTYRDNYSLATVPKVGVFVKFWRWLFGDPLPPPEVVYKDKIVEKIVYKYPAKCGNSLCGGKTDLRCNGGNCTFHCSMYCNCFSKSLSLF